MAKPTVGRIVHYRARKGSLTVAAIITKVQLISKPPYLDDEANWRVWLTPFYPPGTGDRLMPTQPVGYLDSLPGRFDKWWWPPRD